MRDKNRVNKVVVKKIIGYCIDIVNLKKMFGSTFEEFEKNFAFQYAAGMCIIQIGELTTRLTEDFKNQNSEIDWIGIKGLRNIYAHDYEKIDIELVWDALTKEIPDLKEKLEKILAEEFN